MGKKDKKKKAAHSMSESEADCDTTTETDAEISSAPQRTKKTKLDKPNVPLYSMEDFSDLTGAIPKIEFPTGLKVRHPLFGIDFEERVGLKRKKKKSKRQSEHHEEESADVKDELASGSEGETPRKKKRKSHKEEVEVMRRIKNELSSPVNSDSDHKMKKPKKSKRSTVFE